MEAKLDCDGETYTEFVERMINVSFAKPKGQHQIPRFIYTYFPFHGPSRKSHPLVYFVFRHYFYTFYYPSIYPFNSSFLSSDIFQQHVQVSARVYVFLSFRPAAEYPSMICSFSTATRCSSFSRFFTFSKNLSRHFFFFLLLSSLLFEEHRFILFLSNNDISVFCPALSRTLV